MLIATALIACTGCAQRRASVTNIIILAPPNAPLGAMRVSATQPVDWSPMQRMLAEHVTAGGRVDYFQLAHHQPYQSLADVYAQIARVGPASQPELFPSRADKLAYYINAHNLFALLAIAPAFGPKTIDPTGIGDLPARLDDGYVFVLGGANVNLAGVRRRVVDLLDGDPRPLLALCTGRRNDPPLRREVYRADALDAQLADQLARVLSGPPWCEINYADKRIELPAGVVDFQPYYWSRYLAQPGRTRDGISFPTVLLAVADAGGRSWINRGISYGVARAVPSDQFNNKPLFAASGE